MSLYSSNQNISSNPLSIDGLITSDFDSITVNGVGLIPYTGASSNIDLNNKNISNVGVITSNADIYSNYLQSSGQIVGNTITASGALSGASVSSSSTITGTSLTTTGAVSGSTLSITNGATIGNLTVNNASTVNSLTVGTTYYSLALIQVLTSTTVLISTVLSPSTFIVGATIKVFGFNTQPVFNTSYVITSLGMTTVYYANFTSGLPVGQYYTSTAFAYVSSAYTGNISCLSISSTLTASLANLTATGTNNISNLTATGTTTISNLSTTGSLTSAGPVICNNTTAIGYWLPSNGTTSIYITDTSANVATPATTLSRYFATGGAVYQDFYGSFNWRATTGLNNALTTTMMSLSNSTLTVSAITNITGATTITGVTGITGNTGVTGTFGVTGTLTQTGGAQTFSLGAYGTSGDYIVPPTNIYGSTVFDGFNGVNIQNQASQYGRNILFLTGRYENSNDGWSWSAPRNAIMFRTQANLNSSASIRYTIQNFFQELGIMCAGKASVPITKWSNDGTMTHTDNMSIGGVVTLTKTGDGVLQLANTATIQVKNSAGTYENFLWARNSDNITYLNYGSAGFHIRNNASTTTMFMTNGGSVGIGHSSPICALDCVGIVNIWSGTRYAVPTNYMSAGSLTIGNTSASFGGGTTGWSSNTAGIMLETNANQEIAVHHAGARVASMIYYRGSNNTMLIGRAMESSWGTATTSIEGQLNCQKSVSMQVGKNIFWDNVSTDSTYGICWNGDGAGAYSIYRSSGAWSAPNYQQLVFSWQTGFVFTCQGQSYGKSYVDFQCTTKHTNGDNSYALYGPNSSWNSYLYVGASQNRVSTDQRVAQVIVTDGNIHADSSYNHSIYLNYYNYSAGSTSQIKTYGGLEFNTLPRQTAACDLLTISATNTVQRSQLKPYILQAFSANWGSGWTLGSFTKDDQFSSVMISGYITYYSPGGGNATLAIRLYNNSTGVYYYYYQTQYTNVTYNHVSYPVNQLVGLNILPPALYTVVVYMSSGSWTTDTNDNVNLSFLITP